MTSFIIYYCNYSVDLKRVAIDTQGDLLITLIKKIVSLSLKSCIFAVLMAVSGSLFQVSIIDGKNEFMNALILKQDV